MASNPIKRRAKQSFFLGFLIALVIMAIVVMLLFTKISSLKEEKEELDAMIKGGAEITVYTTTKNISEGDYIKSSDLIPTTMKLVKNSSQVEMDKYLTEEDLDLLEEKDEEELTEVLGGMSSTYIANLIENAQSESPEKSKLEELNKISSMLKEKQMSIEDIETYLNNNQIMYAARITIPEGTVVTRAMVKASNVDDSKRMVEYNMIVLPSQLKNGDFIDVRLREVRGSESIVLAKKEVKQCTANSVWLEMSEMEILTMNSAIVDAYLTTGAQLRATVYTDGMAQAPAEANYPVNDEVMTAISDSPNILNEAKVALATKWTKTHGEAGSKPDLQVTRSEIDGYIAESNRTEDEIIQKVDAGYTKEATDINTSRNDYVSALEGSGMVGVSYE